MPTEEASGPRGGGYETRLTSYSNLEPAAGRQIAEALVELCREAQARPGAAAPRPAAVPRQAWSYGNLPAAARLNRQ